MLGHGLVSTHVYLVTKFETCIFIRSRDVYDCPKCRALNKGDHLIQTTPLSGSNFYAWASIPKIYLSTQFEACNFLRSEDVGYIRDAKI